MQILIFAQLRTHRGPQVRIKIKRLQVPYRWRGGKNALRFFTSEGRRGITAFCDAAAGSPFQHVLENAGPGLLADWRPAPRARIIFAKYRISQHRDQFRRFRPGGSIFPHNRERGCRRQHHELHEPQPEVAASLTRAPAASERNVLQGRSAATGSTILRVCRRGSAAMSVSRWLRSAEDCPPVRCDASARPLSRRAPAARGGQQRQKFTDQRFNRFPRGQDIASNSLSRDSLKGNFAESPANSEAIQIGNKEIWLCMSGTVNGVGCVTAAYSALRAFMLDCNCSYSASRRVISLFPVSVVCACDDVRPIDASSRSDWISTLCDNNVTLALKEYPGNDIFPEINARFGQHLRSKIRARARPLRRQGKKVVPSALVREGVVHKQIDIELITIQIRCEIRCGELPTARYVRECYHTFDC